MVHIVIFFCASANLSETAGVRRSGSSSAQGHWRPARGSRCASVDQSSRRRRGPVLVAGRQAEGRCFLYTQHRPFCEMDPVGWLEC